MARSEGDKPAVVITGAGGRIGARLRRDLRDDYQLRLIDVRARDAQPPSGTGAAPARSDEQFFERDVTERGALDEILVGASAVIHLAGDPRPSAPWDDLVRNNLGATRALLDGCNRFDVPTVLLASSVHAMGGYYADARTPIGADWAPDPCCLYGVSKIAVEAMGRWHAETTGSSVVAMRLGGFAPVPAGRWQQPTWIGPSDFVRYVRRALERAHGFSAHFVVSRTVGGCWDISNAADDIGYMPELDAASFTPPPAPLPSFPGCRLHGLPDKR